MVATATIYLLFLEFEQHTGQHLVAEVAEVLDLDSEQARRLGEEHIGLARHGLLFCFQLDTEHIARLDTVGNGEVDTGFSQHLLAQDGLAGILAHTGREGIVLAGEGVLCRLTDDETGLRLEGDDIAVGVATGEVVELVIGKRDAMACQDGQRLGGVLLGGGRTYTPVVLEELEQHADGEVLARGVLQGDAEHLGRLLEIGSQLVGELFELVLYRNLYGIFVGSIIAVDG